MKGFKNSLPWLVMVLGFVALLLSPLAPTAVAQLEGLTDFNGIRLTQSTFGTATPQLLIQNSSSANSLEIRNGSATPVFYVDVDGNATYTGFGSGGGPVAGAVGITAPTAVATATPALFVDNLGAGNEILSLRNDATPVFVVGNSGAWSSTGAGTHSSGQTINNWAVVSAPTAIATATPAAVIDSLGVSAILEVRDAATPVARFPNGGGLDMLNGTISNVGAAGTDFSATGGLTLADDLDMSNQPAVNVGAAGTDFGTDGGLTLAAGLTVSAGNTDLAGTLQYGADNLYPLGYASVSQQIVCGTTAVFTATTQVAPTGLTTTTYVIATQITQPAATAAYLTATDPTTASFTLSSWGGDYNAGTTGIAAHWCAVGDQ